MNLRHCSPLCESPVSPLFLPFISRLPPLQACLSLSILSELIDSTSPDNRSALLSKTSKTTMCFCWYWPPWPLLCSNTLLLCTDLTGAARVKASGSASSEEASRWWANPVEVSASETMGTCEADLYTGAAPAGRCRGLVSELSGGAGVCRALEHYLNVFNLGSLWELREEKQEALWEVPRPRITEKVRDGPRKHPESVGRGAGCVSPAVNVL